MTTSGKFSEAGLHQDSAGDRGALNVWSLNQLLDQLHLTRVVGRVTGDADDQVQAFGLVKR